MSGVRITKSVLLSTFALASVVCWANRLLAEEPTAQQLVSDSQKLVLEADTREIPLKEIWALRMPNTRDVRELDPRKNLKVKNTTAIARIYRSLVTQDELREKAGPCFLVVGEGKEALQNAAKVLLEKSPTAKTLPAGKRLSLVFYSYCAPGYVHLQSVSHAESRVTVKYQVAVHQSAEATVHFALIPLDKLPAGKTTVEVVEVAPKKPYSNHALTKRAVCDSCTFVIK